MKKIFILFISAISFNACSDAGNENQAKNTHGVADTKAHADIVILNAEGKWNGDENTNKNVSVLQQKAAALNQLPMQKATAYQNAGKELQTGLDQLIKECKMKGPDHDALHLWLEPLLQEVKELQNVSETVTGERLFHSIRTRLADYNLYFS